MKINMMLKKNISEYVKLFMTVFNSKPWNEHWNEDTALKKITDIMETGTFVGFEVCKDENIIGIICGQKEQSYDGVHFLIQEFLINPCEQGKGYGSKLLDYLMQYLKHEEIYNIYLITSRGEQTEGFYKKRKFKTSNNMIIMSSNI